MRQLSKQAAALGASLLIAAAGVAAPPGSAAGPRANPPRSPAATDDDGGTAARGHPTERAAQAIPGGVPAMRGITPSRAELAASAFTKLDAQQRGYLTADDVSQLDGFAAAFRAGDRDGDGRLTAKEFDTAWRIYSSETR